MCRHLLANDRRHGVRSGLTPACTPRVRGRLRMKITALKPWLVEAPGTYWGEFLFVEVSTDEGVTGWGEITTTTPVANRVVAGTLRQIGELIAGDDPAR